MRQDSPVILFLNSVGDPVRQFNHTGARKAAAFVVAFACEVPRVRGRVAGAGVAGEDTGPRARFPGCLRRLRAVPDMRRRSATWSLRRLTLLPHRRRVRLVGHRHQFKKR